MSIPTDKTIQAGAAIGNGSVLLAETLDYAQKHGHDITFVSGYAPKQLPHDPWRVLPYEGWFVVSVALFEKYALRCVLSREGQVRLYGPGGKPDHRMQIPEAGVFGDAAVGLGYVNRLRAIGSTLMVCGQSRQVYRLEWNGDDPGQGSWADMAGPMRQQPMTEPPDETDEAAFDAWLDANDAIDLVDINGPNESDVYAVGDEAWHWNGFEWRQIALPSDEPLAAIKVISPRDVVLVGHNGTLLRGNAVEGFRDLSSVDDNQNFTGVEWFENRLYLASNTGLFIYDDASRRIQPYRTTLKPELQDTHQLEVRDGVLWSFGFKDLAHFDGKVWTRVHHPDNPPIR